MKEKKKLESGPVKESSKSFVFAVSFHTFIYSRYFILKYNLSGEFPGHILFDGVMNTIFLYFFLKHTKLPTGRHNFNPCLIKFIFNLPTNEAPAHIRKGPLFPNHRSLIQLKHWLPIQYQIQNLSWYLETSMELALATKVIMNRKI